MSLNLRAYFILPGRTNELGFKFAFVTTGHARNGYYSLELTFHSRTTQKWRVILAFLEERYIPT